MPRSTLASLEHEKDAFGAGSAARKLALLARVARKRMRTPDDLARLHEVLCFMRAYADDARVLARVERLLLQFARRPELRRHRDVLTDSGIAGTAIRYRFYWATAYWLALRWPAKLQIERSESGIAEALADALPLLVSRAESVSLGESELPAFAALDRLRARGESDALCLTRLIDAMPGDTYTREAFHDRIEPTYELGPGQGTPSRTLAKHAPAPSAFQATPLARGRPDLRREIGRPYRSQRKLPPREGMRLIELARGAMVTRARDLDAFSYGNAEDVLMIDDGGGLGFAFIGVVPERRALIIATWGYLILRNGVPIGYGDVLATGRSAAVAFNIFETFRGAEAGRNFARLLAALRNALGIESFRLHPYQLGRDNDEAIASGAWWFYFKLGFRPHRADALGLARRETARMAADPAFRSSAATLRRLAAAHLFFDFDRNHRHGLAPVARVSFAVSGALAARTRGSRSDALHASVREAQRITGLRSLRDFSADEREAWRRWSPLVTYAIKGASRWSPADKRALIDTIRAKGGASELDYIRRFAAHPRLALALFEK